jgi:hypothetical protein
MDYAHLRANDSATLQQLRQSLGRVAVASLTPKQQLAYWINLYNVNVVATVVEHYPVSSIRDISTDLIIRLNVFKKDRVPFGNGAISLNTIENDKIRGGFHDPRIHFAINCAARSCPPIRPQAYTGARVDEQLDDQLRTFAAGAGLRIEQRDAQTIIHTTKVMDWFADDFEKWGGGRVAFLRRYAPPEKVRLIPGSGKITLSFDDYDWALNDWKRIAASATTLPPVQQIGGDRVHTILGPDAIRAIDEPQFVRASEASFMRDDEPVVGVVQNGIAKAYSTWHLDHHEIVNDQIGGKAVSVTW